MSYITFNYISSKTQTTEPLILQYPQPPNTHDVIFAGYTSETNSYSPLFDNFGVKIGYVTFNDIVSTLGYNDKIYITENATYFINGQGSISYSYSWNSPTIDTTFPPGTLVATRIIASTNNYYNKTGPIGITINEDGTRNVAISFNN